MHGEAGELVLQIVVKMIPINYVMVFRNLLVYLLCERNPVKTTIHASKGIVREASLYNDCFNDQVYHFNH